MRELQGEHQHVHANVVERGGHLISTIYFLAHYPQHEVEYVINHDCMIVAEFICMLSEKYACSTDDIVVITDMHVPRLTEDMTLLFINQENVYVILLELLHVDGINWAWGKDAIMRYAWAQRGYVPYDHLRWQERSRRGLTNTYRESSHLLAYHHHSCKCMCMCCPRRNA